MSAAGVETLLIADITRDPRTQMRVGLDTKTVASYANDIQEGRKFPPIVVYRDVEGVNWMSDGWHRVAASEKIGCVDIETEVREGTWQDARDYAAEANLEHGLRASDADRKHAAMQFLRDPERRVWSDNKIAEKVGLSHQTIMRLRDEVSCPMDKIDVDETAPAPATQQRKAQRGGTTYEIDTTNIGERQSTPEERERACQMRREGQSKTAIAKTLGRAYSTVEKWTRGIVPPGEYKKDSLGRMQPTHREGHKQEPSEEGGADTSEATLAPAAASAAKVVDVVAPDLAGVAPTNGRPKLSLNDPLGERDFTCRSVSYCLLGHPMHGKPREVTIGLVNPSTVIAFANHYDEMEMTEFLQALGHYLTPKTRTGIIARYTEENQR